MMSAHHVAAELRRRIPGLPIKKLHKLLYYCQGHYLATFDEPMFRETISAYDMGPLVAKLWWAERNGEIPDPTPIEVESLLNTIGYVVSRYGALSGRDLENLTHSEAPWQRADTHRRPGESVRIELDWIKEYFRFAAADDEGNEPALDSNALTAWLRGAGSVLPTDPAFDSRDELLARLAARG